MKVSEVLEIALKKYYGNTGFKCEFMCHAVSDLYEESDVEFSLSDVRAVIRESIDEKYTLEEYLHGKSKVYNRHLESDDDDKEVKMYKMRRAHWLRLIKKLKNEGL